MENGIKHRFIAMPRYGSDVAKYFLANGRILPECTSYRLALQMLDVYEFIHCCGYAHGNLKASNILIAYGKERHQTYLIDFGLASHYTTKDFKRVKEKLLTMPVKVKKAKETFFCNIDGLKNFQKKAPPALTEYFKYFAKMEYNDNPNYEKRRKIFTSAVKALKLSLNGELDFNYKAVPSLKKSPLKTLSDSKLRRTPLKNKANIRMSPVVTRSSVRAAKTVINDRIRE